MSDGTDLAEVPEIQESTGVAEARTELDRAAFDPEAAAEKSGDFQAAEDLESEFKDAMEAAAGRTESASPASSEGTATQDTSGTAADQAGVDAFEAQQDRELAESEKQDAEPEIQAAQEHIQALMEMAREMADQQRDAIGETMFHMAAPSSSDAGDAAILIDAASLVREAEISYLDGAGGLPEMDPDPVDAEELPGTVVEVRADEVPRDAISNQNQDQGEALSAQSEFSQEYQPVESIPDQGPGRGSTPEVRGAVGNTHAADLKFVDLPEEASEIDSPQVTEDKAGKAGFGKQGTDPSRSYSGVVMRQGEVTQDSDWNEPSEPGTGQSDEENDAGDILFTLSDEEGSGTGDAGTVITSPEGTREETSQSGDGVVGLTFGQGSDARSSDTPLYSSTATSASGSEAVDPAVPAPGSPELPADPIKKVASLPWQMGIVHDEVGEFRMPDPPSTGVEPPSLAIGSSPEAVQNASESILFGDAGGSGSSAGTGENLSPPDGEDLLSEFLKLNATGPGDGAPDDIEGAGAQLEILDNYKEVLGVLQGDLGRLEGLLVMYQNLPGGGTGSGFGSVLPTQSGIDQGTFHLPSKQPDGSYILVETTIPLSVPTIQLLIFQLSQHIDQIKDEISALK